MSRRDKRVRIRPRFATPLFSPQSMELDKVLQRTTRPHQHRWRDKENFYGQPIKVCNCGAYAKGDGEREVSSDRAIDLEECGGGVS